MSSLQQKVEKYITTKKEEDFNAIYKHYESKFDYTASNWTKDRHNIIGELNLCLANAIKKYDLSQGVMFNTFFWTCWKNQAGTIKIRKNAKKRGQGTEELYLNQKVKDGESEKEFQDTIEDIKTKKLIDNAIGNIDFYRMLEKISDKKDKLILKMFYEGYLQTDIAKELGLTTAAICIRLKRLAQGKYADLIYKTLKGE